MLLSIVTCVLASDRDVLKDIYNSLNGEDRHHLLHRLYASDFFVMILSGPQWSSNYQADWSSDAGICQWDGVTCMNSQVQQIYLFNSGASGTIPQSINQLASLER